MNACLSGRPLLGELLGKWIWYMLHGSKLCCLRLLKELCIYLFHWFHMPYTCEPLMCHPFVILFTKVPSTLYFYFLTSNLWQSVRRLLTSRTKTFGRCWLCYHPFRFLRSMILCSWDVSCFLCCFWWGKTPLESHHHAEVIHDNFFYGSYAASTPMAIFSPVC